jgi:hypothetical protein
MVLIRRLARGTQADHRHDVGSGVSERVETVGNDADGARGVAQHELCAGDGQVQDEDASKDAEDRAVAIQ